jgi:copper chaperone NosL
MKPTTRVAAAALALLLGLAYMAPLWHIGLDAPQYPEGIGMYIWIDRITGQKPNDLNSINGLNHYIGMKAIVPDAIPELRLMPAIVAALMGLGLVVAAAGRRSLLYGWTILFGIVAVVGLADFWYWGYDYGHDLDPTAAIRIPGFSYQPPVLGSKRLLNFTAHSWPGLGGWAIIAAFAGAAVLAVIELRRNRTAAAVGAAAMLTAACAAPGPGPIRYDSDACDRCRMTISDPAFAAQLVTRTGKIFRFDDPGCLAAFVAAGQVAPADVHSIWTNDHAHPEARVNARDAVFVVSDRIRAPMNGQAAAFASREAAAAFQSTVGGELRHWNDVVARGPS